MFIVPAFSKVFVLPIVIFSPIFAIKATIDGQVVFVPLDPSNSDYAEILKQVEAGDLTIADAD